MKTTNKDNILKKKDGTLVCAYCLSTIKVEHDTYECACEEWINDILYNQEKDDLEDKHDEKVRKILRDAEAELKIKLRLLEKKYKLKKVVRS